jgi:uncharacterized protein (DUF1778 family)
MPATARFELRITPEDRARIERAAELAGEPASAFVRTAAEQRAEQIIREHEAVTTVPAEFFDELMAALDAPARVNDRLAAAGARLAGIQRD